MSAPSSKQKLLAVLVEQMRHITNDLNPDAHAQFSQLLVQLAGGLLTGMPTGTGVALEITDEGVRVRQLAKGIDALTSYDSKTIPFPDDIPSSDHPEGPVVH